MKEKDLRSKIIRALRDRGGFWFVTFGGPVYQQTGLPDICGVYKGTFYGFEVKLPGKEKTLTPRQAATLAAIKLAGGISAMVTSVDQTLEIVNN